MRPGRGLGFLGLVPVVWAAATLLWTQGTKARGRFAWLRKEGRGRASGHPDGSPAPGLATPAGLILPCFSVKSYLELLPLPELHRALGIRLAGLVSSPGPLGAEVVDGALFSGEERGYFWGFGAGGGVGEAGCLAAPSRSPHLSRMALHLAQRCTQPNLCGASLSAPDSPGLGQKHL